MRALNPQPSVEGVDTADGHLTGDACRGRMLVIDTSALIAILLDEPEAPVFKTRLWEANRRLISAANYVEFGTVLAGRRSLKPSKVLHGTTRVLTAAEIEIAPITEELARAALRARIQFGKGFGLRNGLNFGDCFAYALARQHKAPLLYVGDDFSRTDVVSAL